MQERHSNRDKYFNEQIYTTEKYVIPFIDEVKKVTSDCSVLEIGCGEGGNLVPFLEIGCQPMIGVDLSESKINDAKIYFKKYGQKGESVQFLYDDIYKSGPEKLGKFDIIILRDVIEHIHDQKEFMDYMRGFIKENGVVFFGFPNWLMPFGGHQQICRSKYLSMLPYFHLLPGFLYKAILKVFGESNSTIENLMEIKSTGINIEQFEKILSATNYKIDKKAFYFINPNYEIKFKLKPRLSSKIIASIPWFRNFFITANYYVVSKGA
jgi:2-polyprenyl-3-methyl-5-hydroxy-6-metoxy-1,4-benzoquinol methylase